MQAYGTEAQDRGVLLSVQQNPTLSHDNYLSFCLADFWSSLAFAISVCRRFENADNRPVIARRTCPLILRSWNKKDDTRSSQIRAST
jgi:hypothetical protein